MKLDSHWFEKVRIPPRGRAEPREEPKIQGCDHPGCGQPGGFRAPKGRDHEGQYFNFCMEHVRAYNASYDYFRGMSADALAEYQKSASTGHRPTWQVGTNGANAAASAQSRAEAFRNAAFDDPFDMFAGGTRTREAPKPEARPLKNVERQSLETMDLHLSATSEQIRARYKELVKRLHPDANGGDRGSEGKLREIIQAYKYLRQAGLA